MTNAEIQAYIRQYIKANGNGDITGAVLQDVLLKMTQADRLILEITAPPKGVNTYNSRNQMLNALGLTSAQFTDLLNMKYDGVKITYTTSMGDEWAYGNINSIVSSTASQAVSLGYYDIDWGGCAIGIMFSDSQYLVMVNHLE